MTLTFKIDRASEDVPETVVAAVRDSLARDYSAVEAVAAARMWRAVGRLVADLDEAALARAASAPSDLAVLLEAVEQPESLALLREDDPLAQARLRGVSARQRLLNAEGGTVSAAEAAALLGITRQAVDKRRRAGRLLAVTMGRRGYAYPVWQFDPAHAGVIAGLEAVLSTLAGHDPWMRMAFLLTPNTRLPGGVTPLAALRAGQLDAVLRTAQAAGEQGAG